MTVDVGLFRFAGGKQALYTSAEARYSVKLVYSVVQPILLLVVREGNTQSSEQDVSCRREIASLALVISPPTRDQEELPFEVRFLLVLWRGQIGYFMAWTFASGSRKAGCRTRESCIFTSNCFKNS